MLALAALFVFYTSKNNLLHYTAASRRDYGLLNTNGNFQIIERESLKTLNDLKQGKHNASNTDIKINYLQRLLLC